MLRGSFKEKMFCEGDGGGYDFALNVDQIDELIASLKAAYEELGKEGDGKLLDQVFEAIKDIGSEGSWTGETYKLFRDKCFSYQTAVYSITDLIEAFYKAVNEYAKSQASDAITCIKQELNIE